MASAEVSSAPDIEVIQDGDLSKSDPFTIIFIANPALETPWESGTFAADPVLNDQAAFDACVHASFESLMGLLPGQAETLLADPAIGPKIRVVSVFEPGLSPAGVVALVGEDSVSNLLVARREVFVGYLGRLGLQADVAYAISKSATHDRASAWYTTDNDAGPGIDFTLDRVKLSHRFYNLIPGVVALHTTSRSVTPLHEFSHALSSYSNGSVVDLYLDNDPAFNNKRGRPIPDQFATYDGGGVGSDPSRGGIGYPTEWQSYHAERVAAGFPAIMDNYWLSATTPEACSHDKITREFLRDRLLAKISR